MRAGYLGGLAAWAGFTLPSAVVLPIAALSPGLTREARRRRDRYLGCGRLPWDGFARPTNLARSMTSGDVRPSP